MRAIRIISSAALVAGLLAALAAVSACSVSVGDGGESASPSAGGATETYTNDQYGFGFERESRFAQTDASALAETSADFEIGFADAGGTKVGGDRDLYLDAILVRVYKLTQSVTPEQVPQIRPELEQAYGEMERTLPEAQMEPLRDTTLNGTPGFESAYTFVMDEVTVEARIYFLFKGDYEYELVVQSSQQTWGENEAALQKTIDSFTVK